MTEMQIPEETSPEELQRQYDELHDALVDQIVQIEARKGDVSRLTEYVNAIDRDAVRAGLRTSDLFMAKGMRQMELRLHARHRSRLFPVIEPPVADRRGPRAPGESMSSYLGRLNGDPLS